MGTRPRIGVGGRFAVALVLTLGPTLALGYIGYIGYRAVSEREQGLRVAYGRPLIWLILPGGSPSFFRSSRRA